jgi:hypothetical protein
VRYLVASQLYADSEAQLKGSKQILDDCTWSSCAAATSWASGYAVTYTAAQGVAAFEKATGRKDKQGVSDAGGSLAEAVKVIAQLGGKARYAKSWEDAVAAAKQGAALMVWVQQPVAYPVGVRISAWHDRWHKWWAKTNPAHLRAGYGHMTSAAWCEDHGWQWACPTRDEKVSAEKYGVQLTEEQLRQIANSKVAAKKLKVDYKALLIVTHPARATVPTVTAAKPEPVAPAAPVQQAAPAPVVQPQPKTPSAVDVQLEALKRVDWASVGGRALNAASGAAAAAAKVKGAGAKMIAFLKYIKDETRLDSIAVDFVKTFVTVSISVALGLGIPLLDIQGGDFRTILSAGLASGLQIVVKALDTSPDYGLKRK